MGMVQRWIDIDPAIDLVSFGQSNDERLRILALFDAIINNTDRKFGHLLIGHEGDLYGCDHGVTFHHQDKLRTVLWQFAGDMFSEKEIGILTFLLSHREEIHQLLGDLLDSSEIRALFNRSERLLASRSFPFPSDEWPAVPWPPV